MEHKKHSSIKRFLYIQWHKFTSRRFSVRLLVFKILLFGLWFFAFIVPLLRSGKIGPGLAFIGGLSFILYGIAQNYPGIRGFQRKNFVKSKIKRKLATADVLDKMLAHRLSNVQLTSSIGTPLLEEVMEVIANHVRALRYDKGEEKIFCSLLVEHDEDNLKVIARSKNGVRRDRAVYVKSGMLAYAAMTQKRVLESGDIFIDFPSTPADKPYKSVLVIPIFYQDQPIAALSVDSSEPYHFTGKEEQINTRLMSYTVLLKKIMLEYKVILCSTSSQAGRDL